MRCEKFFQVTHNSDQTEGRGYTISLGFLPSKEEALNVVTDPRYAKWCVMGYHDPKTAHYNVRESEILIFDTAEEFWEYHSEEGKRKAALAKLNDEDIRVLGLKR